MAIKKSVKTGKARTGKLRKAMKEKKEERRGLGPKAVSLEWVKSHIGIADNEAQDEETKSGTEEEDPAFLVIMERGLKGA